MMPLLRLWDWLASLFGAGAWRVRFVEDVPSEPRGRTVYLLGGDVASSWAAALRCPCGCGELIQLSLIGDDEPSWQVRVGRGGRVTLHPSVWRVRGCHSHFHVREGRIVWARHGRPQHGRPAAGRAPHRRPSL